MDVTSYDAEAREVVVRSRRWVEAVLCTSVDQ